LRSNEFAILFASYGTTRLNIRGTPPYFTTEQRIMLQHVNHGKDFPVVGLFFTKEEFDDLVKRTYSKYSFDETFFAKLFEVMEGHIGAICDFIRVIERHDVSFIACYE
jgi:hypothetical protein